MKEVKIDNNKISLVLNYLIIIFSLFAFIVMFTGIKFTYYMEPVLETTKFGTFKFFTVDSNLLMAIAAILFSHQERKLINGKIKKIPVGYYIFKFIGTVSVTLTFLVVFIYLARIVNGGAMALLQNSNMFFHLIIPVLSIMTFLIFERTNKIKFNYVISSLIPVLVYGIFYIINIMIHMENGEILPKYDWYHFAQNGISSAYITGTLIIVSTFVIGLIIWAINRKR